METELQQALAEITGSVKSGLSDLATKHSELATRQTNFSTQLDLVRAELLKPHQDSPGSQDAPGFKGYVSPGQQFVEHADIELAKKGGRMRFRLDQVHPAFETKTLIDSTALGFSTPGILNAERISSIVSLPRRRLVVRDLMRSKPVTAGQVDWIQELAFTNAASPVVEGEEKAESADSFQIASEKVRTLAHWIPLTKNALADLPELRRFIDENLVYGLKVIEEWELLFGDGSGEHLHGLWHQAPSYLGSYSAGSDTVLDKLRHIVLELAMKDEECTAFVLNPKDWHDAELVKTAPGGANTGAYVIGDPIGGVLRVPTVWGRPVVVTPVMPAGNFLAGQFANAVIGDRLPATLDLSENVNDDFIHNRVVIRCEERISAVLLRATSLLKGTL
jgi:HK97 family phage major capsid protein